MEGLGHRAQTILFLAFVLVPGVALIALSIRIVSQDRELRSKRQEDERQRIVAGARTQLAGVLESIRRDEIATELEPGESYRHAETVLAAWVEGGRLMLPWDAERDRTARQCRYWIERPDFAASIRACETGRTSDCYRKAAAAGNPVQAAYARWLWAQALESAGRAGLAASLYREVLATGPEAADEDGTPLALHAAQALISHGDVSPEVIARVNAVLLSRPWLAPLSAFLVRDIAQTLARRPDGAAAKAAAEQLQERAAAKVRTIEQAEALQRDFVRLHGLLQSRSWAVYGDDLWLVGTVGNPNGAILAVRGPDVFRRVQTPPGARFVDSRESTGLPLGAGFPGLKLALPFVSPAAVDIGDELQRRLFHLATILVVAATMFGAYLLWRDLRREMRATELRAQFVASVTHELKTPLTSIRMFAETLQMGRCRDSQTQMEYLGTIVEECERLSRLIDDVLLFSKAEHGKRAYRLLPLQPADAVYAAARALEHALSQGGYELRVSVEDGLPRVLADRDALEQAVLNLLSNALKFSGDARAIEVALYRDERDVVVRVTDHGVGIAEEEQARIFEKFYRAPAHETRLIPGTGLGLALVAQIMKAHGGCVAVESAPGEGSKFYLRLPAEPERAGEA